ncbi:hypothetical protein O3P69_004439 [Scylla paramamosain]|uniref:Uncharacterized protein n=1 Tax=Scylla paramamosain TaxID=85552 RepID=A0AAW0UD71_SCYPA
MAFRHYCCVRKGKRKKKKLKLQPFTQNVMRREDEIAKKGQQRCKFLLHRVVTDPWHQGHKLQGLYYMLQSTVGVPTRGSSRSSTVAVSHFSTSG